VRCSRWSPLHSLFGSKAPDPAAMILQLF